MSISRMESCTIGTFGTLTALAVGMSWAIQYQIDDRISVLYNATLANTTDTQSLVSDIQNLYSGNLLSVSRVSVAAAVLGTCHISASLFSYVRRRQQQNRLLNEHDNQQEDLNMLKLFHRTAYWEAPALLVASLCMATIFNEMWLRYN